MFEMTVVTVVTTSVLVDRKNNTPLLTTNLQENLKYFVCFYLYNDQWPKQYEKQQLKLCYFRPLFCYFVLTIQKKSYKSNSCTVQNYQEVASHLLFYD